MYSSFNWSSGWVLLVGFVIALGIAGVVLMDSSRTEGVRAGSVLVLASSVAAFPTLFGFMIGSGLMLVGGIVGLVWRSSSIGAGRV